MMRWRGRDTAALAIVAFWKVLTLAGTSVLAYAAIITPGYGVKTLISTLAFGWFLMFLFLEPDV